MKVQMDDDAKRALGTSGWGTNTDCFLFEALSLALHRQIYGHDPAEWGPEQILRVAKSELRWRI